MASELKKYTLGSGHVHLEVFTGALPENWNEFFKSTDNLIGRIKGGCELEYSTEKFSDSDDLGYVKIDDITEENVTMRTGVMTWNAENLEKLCSTARVTNNSDGTITIKIGGLANQNDARYVIGFEHKNKDIRVVIVGKNTEGFSLTFAQDSVTVIDAVFTAEAQDNEGTLIMMNDMRYAPVLNALKIGSNNLMPEFSPFEFNYTASTKNASDIIKAPVKNAEHTVEIKLNGTGIENNTAAAWSADTENTLTVIVKKDENIFNTYTVKVTHATPTA